MDIDRIELSENQFCSLDEVAVVKTDRSTQGLETGEPWRLTASKVL